MLKAGPLNKMLTQCAPSLSTALGPFMVETPTDKSKQSGVLKMPVR